MKWKTTEGCNALSIGGQQFDVVDGHVEVPDGEHVAVLVNLGFTAVPPEPAAAPPEADSVPPEGDPVADSAEVVAEQPAAEPEPVPEPAPKAKGKKA